MYSSFRCVPKFFPFDNLTSKFFKFYRRPANICWPWRRLQNVFRVTIFCLPRRLENVLKTSWRRLPNTSWRHLGRRRIVTLNTSWRRLEDMCWRRLEDMSWKPLEDMSWRPLEDMSSRRLQDVFKTSWRQTKCLLGISLFNRYKSLSGKSISHISTSDKSRRMH